MPVQFGSNLQKRIAPARDGFTLLELLVVIAIIGILAGLLAPAAARAKNKTRSVACLSQLRQLGMAVRMYAEDFQNRLPSAEVLPSMPSDPKSPLPRICDVLGPYLGRLPESTNSATVFHCPADKVGRFVKEGSSYEWNVGLNGHALDETRKGRMKIVIAEVVDGKPPERIEVDKDLAFPPETTPFLLDYEEYHGPRRPSGKNVVFMDGHATVLNPDE